MVTAISRQMPGLIFPGHQAMPGSRMPPSQVEPLPSRNSPAEPPCSLKVNHGPLSLEKNTTVFSAMPSSFSVSST